MSTTLKARMDRAAEQAAEAAEQAATLRQQYADAEAERKRKRDEARDQFETERRATFDATFLAEVKSAWDVFVETGRTNDGDPVAAFLDYRRKHAAAVVEFDRISQWLHRRAKGRHDALRHQLDQFNDYIKPIEHDASQLHYADQPRPAEMVKQLAEFNNRVNEWAERNNLALRRQPTDAHMLGHDRIPVLPAEPQCEHHPQFLRVGGSSNFAEALAIVVAAAESQAREEQTAASNALIKGIKS